MNNTVPKQHTLETYQSNNQDWHWKISSKHGEIIFASAEGYKYKKICDDNLNHVLTVNNRIMAVYYLDKNGKYRCKLENSLGQVLALSEGYSFKTACEKAVSNLYYDLSH